ncbi:MAG: NHLP bacteriocin export ABC transporter permease/ATPase subunit, partial [Acidobacteriota bacterium]
RVGGNEPFMLDDPDVVIWLARGQVDLFAVDRDGDAVRRHVGTAPTGALLFGLGAAKAHLPFGPRAASPQRQRGLLGVAAQDTELVVLRAADLRELARVDEHVDALGAAVEGWVRLLLEGVRVPTPPRNFELLTPGDEHSLAPRTAGRAAAPVVWVRHIEGRSRFLGLRQLTMPAAGYLLPVTERTWLVASSSPAADDDAPPVGAQLSIVATAVLVRSGGLWEALRRFHELLLDLVDVTAAETNVVLRARAQARAEHDAQRMRGANRALVEVIGDDRDDLPADGLATAVDDPLLAACTLVGAAQDFTMRAPRRADADDDGDLFASEAAGPDAGDDDPSAIDDRIARICAASRVRCRDVILADTWWRRDNGPLLALRVDAANKTFRPVALLPRSAWRYDMVDPAEGTRVAVDAEVADGLHPSAYSFYAPLPEKALSLIELIVFGLRGQRGNLRTVMMMGLFGGVLSMFVPLVTGQLFGTVIPSANETQLWQLTAALGVAAIAGAAFQVVRSIAMLRLSGRLEGSMQAAVWDRLLSLPVSFFRDYTVGDLADRAQGVEQIRERLTGQVTTSVLGAVFSVFSVGLMFVYSPNLAWVALGLLLLLFGISATLAWLELRHQRTLLRLQGHIAGLLYGLISGIAKLRANGAEPRAYARWAEAFAEQRAVAIRVRRTANVRATFLPVFQLASIMVIYGWLIRDAEVLLKTLAISDFLAFMAAFGQAQAAALSLVGVLSSVMVLVPLYERLAPLLRTVPEVDPGKVEADELRGDLELGHITFRYDPQGPPVLDDISLTVEPGSFVALVGPSGSGKSTIIRLLLGFEKPEAGSVYYDGQDLPSLDVQSVRRQIGVVLQSGQPMVGDVFSNIIGNRTDLTLDDAWRAARVAGLEDDLKAMPMGMQTVISEGGGTFSGGQRQRLMIARAVVHRPRILIFDEATSALDNRTQEHISRALERLKATRIVVAHRLSTIRNADRIYVLERGRVVESGTYRSLIARDGPFRQLAARQLLEDPSAAADGDDVDAAAPPSSEVPS